VVSQATTVQMLLSAGVVLVTVRAVGSLLAVLRQPRVVGEIIAGVLLGPSVLGLFWPAAMHALFPGPVIDAFRVLAQFGLVMFMFLVGLELPRSSLRAEGRRTLAVSSASLVVPFLAGAGVGVLLHPAFGTAPSAWGFCLFLGAAMSVTAFPVLARLLQESGLFHSRIGVIALGSAALTDVLAWCMLAVVVAVAAPGAHPQPIVLLLSSAAYLAVMAAVVGPLLHRRHTPELWLILAVAFVSAWTTEQLGIHAVFGAFVAGAVMPRDEQWRDRVQVRLDATVTVFALPFFFVVVGLSTRVDALRSWWLAGVLVLVTGIAVVTKFGASTLAARAVGERWRDAATLGVLMNTRGLTEIVILSVGLQIGVIETRLFTIMVLMAVITTVMAAPALNLLQRTRDPVAVGPDPALVEASDRAEAEPVGHGA
jgi:Kef-type K+ transport system membrane component KefB